MQAASFSIPGFNDPALYDTFVIMKSRLPGGRTERCTVYFLIEKVDGKSRFDQIASLLFWRGPFSGGKADLKVVSIVLQTLFRYFGTNGGRADVYEIRTKYAGRVREFLYEESRRWGGPKPASFMDLIRNEILLMDPSDANNADWQQNRSSIEKKKGGLSKEELDWIEYISAQRELVDFTIDGFFSSWFSSPEGWESMEALNEFVRGLENKP
jgi:hypothetical protein